MVVGGLNNFDYNLIPNPDFIINRINELMSSADNIDKMIFEAFLKKKPINDKDLKIFTDNVEPEALQQIYSLLRLKPSLE